MSVMLLGLTFSYLESCGRRCLLQKKQLQYSRGLQHSNMNQEMTEAGRGRSQGVQVEEGREVGELMAGMDG
jgi:hypothetical protein